MAIVVLAMAMRGQMEDILCITSLLASWSDSKCPGVSIGDVTVTPLEHIKVLRLQSIENSRKNPHLALTTAAALIWVWPEDSELTSWLFVLHKYSEL